MKIAFFDIDGTITSEKDGSIPDSAVLAIRQAKANGNLMFINTGRCFQNVEQRFKAVGFDGLVCGCGTNIYCGDKEILYIEQPRSITLEIINAARKHNMEILFESKRELVFDLAIPLRHERAKKLLQSFRERHYDMTHLPDSSDFTCDKFVTWIDSEEQLASFRQTSDKYFECIDRGGCFREFVPLGYSKASGIQTVLDYYGCSLEDCYVFGDSMNDYSMLSYSPNSIVMGNAEDSRLLEIASYVTGKASEGGLAQALKHYGFI